MKQILYYIARTLLRPALACLLLVGALTLTPKVANGPGVSYDTSDFQCAVSAVYHEARGEPDTGKRAVLEVVYNRAKKTGKSVCSVVAARSQFPWYKKKGLVPLTEETVKYYTAASTHPRVLRDEKFLFFNRLKPPGHSCRKIGNHIFCKE